MLCFEQVRYLKFRISSNCHYGDGAKKPRFIITGGGTTAKAMPWSQMTTDSTFKEHNLSNIPSLRALPSFIFQIML